MRTSVPRFATKEPTKGGRHDDRYPDLDLGPEFLAWLGEFVAEPAEDVGDALHGAADRVHATAVRVAYRPAGGSWMVSTDPVALNVSAAMYGGEHEDPDIEGCEHLTEGPYQEVTVSAGRGAEVLEHQHVFQPPGAHLDPLVVRRMARHRDERGLGDQER